MHVKKIARRNNFVKKLLKVIPKFRRAPKPVRTPKKPVRVVFVCYSGASSGILSKDFNRVLNMRNIYSVKASSLSINDFREKELKKRLKKADFVVHFMSKGTYIKRLQKNVAPKTRLLSYGLLGGNSYQVVMEKIRENFTLKE